MHPFDYEKPTSLAETGKLLAQAEGSGYVLAGGTHLLLGIGAGSIEPQLLVDIKDILELQEISFSADSGLVLGAATTLSALAAHSDIRRHYPLLADVSGRVGYARIRNRATVGGNICIALPSSDVPTILICHDALCHIWSPHGERTVPLVEFCTGPGQTILQSGELLARITVPAPKSQTYGVYHNLRQGQGGSITVAGAAVFARKVEKQLTDWRIALTAAAPTHIRAYEAEKHLNAEMPSATAVELAVELAENAAEPSDDIRASARYRKAMVNVLVRRGIDDVTGQLMGRGR